MIVVLKIHNIFKCLLLIYIFGIKQALIFTLINIILFNGTILVLRCVVYKNNQKIQRQNHTKK